MNLSNDVVVPANPADKWAVRIAHKMQSPAEHKHFVHRMYRTVVNFFGDWLFATGRLLELPGALENCWSEAMKPYSNLYREHSLTQPVWTRALADDRLTLAVCCLLLRDVWGSLPLALHRADNRCHIIYRLEGVIRQDLIAKGAPLRLLPRRQPLSERIAQKRIEVLRDLPPSLNSI